MSADATKRVLPGDNLLFIAIPLKLSAVVQIGRGRRDFCSKTGDSHPIQFRLKLRILRLSATPREKTSGVLVPSISIVYKKISVVIFV